LNELNYIYEPQIQIFMKNLLTAALVFSLLFSSCGLKKKPAGEASVEDTGNLKQFELVEAWRTDTLFLVPESVIYDRDNDVVYVSNLNYEPRKKDGNGFISKLSTDGEILNLKWVEGLSSPKGMGIFDGKLYVSDVDEVVVIDITAGKIIQRIPVEGAGMLNDITVDDSGNVYVSDTDGNCIFLISNGVVSSWLATGLNAPNGLLIDGERLLLASTGSQDFVAIDLATKEVTMITGGINAGDGIARASIPGHSLVSDWNGEVFLVYPDGRKASLLNTKEKGIGSADIDYIPEKNLLLVPTFYGQNVVAYNLVEKK
jgi:hypothetical protein